VAVGDFNHDGALDLVTANQNSHNVTVLLGNGDGTFRDGVSYFSGSFAREVKVGTLDQTGELDLVVANQGNNTVSVLLGNGDGTFRAPVNYVTGSAPTSLTLADLRGNGVLDILTANYTFGGSTSSLSVLPGNGDGTFQQPQNYSMGAGAHNVQAADFDGDGNLDIVVAAKNAGAVYVFRGNGDGTLQAAQRYEVGSGPDFVAVGNFDGSGAPSLAVSNADSNNVSILLNQAAHAAVVVLAGPSRADVGQPYTFTVTILNQFGGVYKGYTGNVSFASSDGLADLPDSYTFTEEDSGSHTFTAVFRTEHRQTLTVTDMDLELEDTLTIRVR
jgi:hypothetical protein